jgi:hypothetical protein
LDLEGEEAGNLRALDGDWKDCDLDGVLVDGLDL